MKTTDIWRRAAWAGVLALLSGLSPAMAAPAVEQAFDLHPGWNAVYLEVQPADNSMGGVFGSIPAASVWAWQPKTQSAEFTRNVSETMVTDSRWLAWFPSNRVECMFNSLFRVYANKAYLIKLAGDSNVSWTVSGAPALPAPGFKPGVFNLAGFPLDPEVALPDLGVFFGPSAALAGQPVYRLNSTGAWESATQTVAQVMRAGEALWVYSRLETEYMGPVSVSIATGTGLDFSGIATEKKVTLANLSGSAVTVRIRNRGGAGQPVSYWHMAGTETLWDPLPDPLAVTLAAGGSYVLRLSVRREAFAEDVYETVIEITSDLGTRVRIPLSALKTVTL